MNWTLERTFASYTEASDFKKMLQATTRGATLQVKIKRYAPVNGVERYGIKTRSDPSLADAIKQVEEKVAKREKKAKA